MSRFPVALALSAAILIVPTAYGQIFSLRFSGPPSDFISLGQSYSYDSSNAAVDLFSSTNPVELRVSSPPFPNEVHFWTLVLQAYPNNRLDPGVYSGAARWPFQDKQPGLSLHGDGRGCNTLTGAFTVISSSYGPDGHLTALHATFEQHCEGSAAALTGEIILQPSSIPAVSTHLKILLSLCLVGCGLVALRSA
jgi:hypothetical protein